MDPECVTLNTAVALRVVVDDPDEFTLALFIGLIELIIEYDEEELNDAKAEGLSDSFCAAEGDIVCVRE